MRQDDKNTIMYCRSSPTFSVRTGSEHGYFLGINPVSSRGLQTLGRAPARENVWNSAFRLRSLSWTLTFSAVSLAAAAGPGCRVDAAMLINKHIQ